MAEYSSTIIQFHFLACARVCFLSSLDISSSDSNWQKLRVEGNWRFSNVLLGCVELRKGRGRSNLVNLSGEAWRGGGGGGGEKK